MTQGGEPDIAPYIKAVQGMKVLDIVVLDVAGLASFADCFYQVPHFFLDNDFTLRYSYYALGSPNY